ncbi:hypothetical protein BN1723_018458, partial [Verticillium longisporum]
SAPTSSVPFSCARTTSSTSSSGFALACQRLSPWGSGDTLPGSITTAAFTLAAPSPPRSGGSSTPLPPRAASSPSPPSTT